MAFEGDDLLDALWEVPALTSTCTFACGGEVKPPKKELLPRYLAVNGLGNLSLPLSSDNALKLRALSEQAPYGRGRSTVVDTSIRRAWEVDAAMLKAHLLATVAKNVAGDVLRGLNLQEEAVELKLYKLLLYEPGGHFKLHRDTEKEPGMLATYILQLPTETGHEGATLVVRHCGVTKRFGFTRHSEERYYHVGFFADCEHELEEVIDGTRLCLVFNIVRKGGSMQEKFPGFLSTLSRVEAALVPWMDLLKTGVFKAPVKLAVVLSHKYTKANLCFSGLKGRDKIVAELLRSCRCDLALEVYLCIFTKHELWSPIDDELIDSDVSTGSWVDTDDRRVMLNISIDYSEILKRKDEDDDAFADLSADEEEHETYTGNAAPTDEYWYHIALIVVWPKGMWITGFSSQLEFVESNPSTPRLRQLLSICAKFPGEVWHSRGKKGEVTCRLLKLCLKAGECEDVLRLIPMLGRDFGTKDKVWYEGIGSTEVAKMLALIVHSKEEVYGTVIIEKLLLQSRVVAELAQYAILGLELEHLRCHEAAINVVSKTMYLMSCCDCTKFQGSSGLGTMATLVFSLQREDKAMEFVNLMQSAATPALCEVIIKLADAAVRMNDVPGMFGIFIKLCQIVPGRVFDVAPVINMASKVVRVFMLLEDSQLMESLVQSLLRESASHGALLKQILSDDKLWQQARATEMGRNVISRLTDERIGTLSRESKPVLNWCQPSASFPSNPALEEFLRGPSHNVFYRGFNNIAHAREFASKWNAKRMGFTAKAGGCGKSAYCELQKSRDMYDEKCRQWKAVEQELSKLRSLRETIQLPGNNTPADIKRQKVDHIIDLT